MILLLLSIISIIICEIIIKKSNNKEIEKHLKFLTRLIIITTILEFSLFNFRHFESLKYEEIKFDSYTIGKGLEIDEEGTLTLLNTEENYILIEDLDKHIDNIHIDVDGTGTKGMTIGFGFTDRANGYYKYLDNQVIDSSSKHDGDTFRTHFRGSTNRLKIFLEPKEIGGTFKINEISINKKVPLNITILRPSTLTLIIFILYFFRPSSFIYKMSLFDRKSKKILLAVSIITISLFGLLTRINEHFTNEDFEPLTRYQYHLLTESLTKGKTYLEVEPSYILKDMYNPYDTKARKFAFENTGEYYMWDTAYFNNRYYVYFGIAPVITYLLPYYVITGNHLRISTCVTISLVFTIVGIFILLYEICKRWYKNAKLGHYLIIALTFITGSGLLSVAGRPDHYTLPIIMAIMFSIFGITFWLKALDKKHTSLYLFLGSLMLASIAAARPQLLLTSFLCIPIFYKFMFKDRKLFSKESIKDIICFILPYIIIAILLMLYNYVRFNSPFDFGANYNLTTNDMTRRGFIIDRIPLGLFYYLINPISLISMFPFVMRNPIQTGYIGTTISENMGAGFLVINFITLSTIYIFKRKDEFKDKIPYYITILSIIFSIIIIIADVEMAGILPRYILDFGFLMYIATSITLFHILNKNKKNELLTKIIYISFIVVTIYNFLLMFSDSWLYNSDIFNIFRHYISFWQ